MSAAENLPAVVDIHELPSVDQQAFKRLKLVHRKVIYLHMAGQGNADIAHVMGMSSAWVGNVLRNPLVVPVLDTLYADYDVELRGMTGLAVEAMREILETGEPSEKLKAADLLFKRQGAYNVDRHADNNAEAVIARFLGELENVRDDKTQHNKLLQLTDAQTEVIDV